jgi:hypothetical protein
MDVDVETGTDTDTDTYARVDDEGANKGLNENESTNFDGPDVDIATDRETDFAEPPPPSRDSSLSGAESLEKLEDNAFLLELSRLKLDVSEWCMSWGGVDKFAGYIQLKFYSAIMKDDVIYRFGNSDDDSAWNTEDRNAEDAEPLQPPPPFSIGYFFMRWNGDMGEKVKEGNDLLNRAKFLGGGMVSWVSSGGKHTSVLQMSWWKYQHLWTETTSVIQELSRGMGKIDATCQLLVNHPDFDFRPSFTWRPPYRPPFNPHYDLPPEDKAAP